MLGTRRSAASQVLDPGPARPVPPSPPSQPKTVARNSRSTTTSTPRPATPSWSHAPTATTLLWLAFSLPLVAWDIGYVLGRPATMPGGWAHAPLWTPYARYGAVDHMYGLKQWQRGSGFPAALACLNAVETAMYLLYLGLWWSRAAAAGAAPARRIAGRAGAVAVVVGLSASVVTVSKTDLYWLNEYFSNFDNIGHNKPWDLLLLWILPNGAWLVLPSYMIYQLGSEIVDAITIASHVTGNNSPSKHD